MNHKYIKSAKVFEIMVFVMLMTVAVYAADSIYANSETISEAEAILEICDQTDAFVSKAIAISIFCLIVSWVLSAKDADDTQNYLDNNIFHLPLNKRGVHAMNEFKGFSLCGPRESQQDAFRTHFSNNFKLGIVCDGAGGHSGGEHASETTAQVIVDSAKQWLRFNSPDGLINLIIEAVDAAHHRIFNDANIKPELRGMATTLALACVHEDMAHILWSGDSRVYLLRNGQLTCLTRDHSVVEQMVVDGKLTKDQARCHPENNAITRAIGFGKSIPGGRTINLEPEDGLLLVSDGVMDSLDDIQILNVLANVSKEDDQLVAKAVVNAAIEDGTTDNTTAVWYRHRKFHKEPVSRFHQLQMAQVVNNNISNSIYERTGSMQSPENQPQYQVEIIDSLGNSEKHRLSDSLEIGRNPQSGVPIDDPYLDLSHVKLEPTNEGVKITSLSSRVGTFIRLSDEPIVQRAPFELLAGATLVRVSSTDTAERSV